MIILLKISIILFDLLYLLYLQYFDLVNFLLFARIQFTIELFHTSVSAKGRMIEKNTDYFVGVILSK